MPQSMPEKKTSSPDYPQLVRLFFEASGDASSCKLLPGLFVVATPIGNLGDISLRALVTLASVDAVACEDTRTSGAMLTKYGLKKPLFAYHDHNSIGAGKKILDMIATGQSVALICDAGTPLISDPGYPLVADCRSKNYDVTVIPGANAAVMALAGSGLPTDQFHFIGFLPPKTVARRKEIASLRSLPGTLVFYEAPSRVGATLADLEKDFGGQRPVVIARELTKLFEETRSGTLADMARFYATEDVKGEVVLLVGPADARDGTTDHDIDGLLKEAFLTQSLRDAVAYVSMVTGVKRSEVYARALAMNEKKR